MLADIHGSHAFTLVQAHGIIGAISSLIAFFTSIVQNKFRQ